MSKLKVLIHLSSLELGCFSTNLVNQLIEKYIRETPQFERSQLYDIFFGTPCTLIECGTRSHIELFFFIGKTH